MGNAIARGVEENRALGTGGSTTLVYDHEGVLQKYLTCIVDKKNGPFCHLQNLEYVMVKQIIF